MTADPRSRDLAHVGSVELFTATPDETLTFFVDLMGMDEVGRRRESVYVHAWDDYERFTVKITARDAAGVGRTYLRAAGPDALRRRVAVLESDGAPGEWVEDELGLGAIYLTADPDGHAVGLYWETERTSRHRTWSRR